MQVRPVYVVALAAIVAAAIYAAKKGGTGGLAGVAQDFGGAVVEVVTNAAAGGVVAVGEAVGIPATSQPECERALAEGRTWDASFACPAGTFLKNVFNW